MPAIPDDVLDELPVKERWRTEKINLTSYETGEDDEVEEKKRSLVVRAFGALAIHPDLCRCAKHKSMWTVTHIPTGLAIVVVKSDTLAVEVAERLWSEHRNLLKLKKKKVIQAIAPKSLIAWLKSKGEVTHGH